LNAETSQGHVFISSRVISANIFFKPTRNLNKEIEKIVGYLEEFAEYGIITRFNFVFDDVWGFDGLSLTMTY